MMDDVVGVEDEKIVPLGRGSSCDAQEVSLVITGNFSESEQLRGAVVVFHLVSKELGRGLHGKLLVVK
ncbi:hypothetical protein [Rubritalea tangerina]|uniref:hypothetical protein n=1 Tax=Rubritalea tangerina TaxID=430798 RepID=UPI0036246008